MSVISRAIVAFKAMTQMQWGRTTSWFSMLLGGTTFDYRAAAGDGRTNAAVMACVRWAQRTLPEAPLQVMTRNADGELKPVPNHPLQQRLENPNPFYSGLHLIGAVVADLMLYGNAYVLKARTRDRRLAQLWWVPATMIEPKWPDNDPTVYISHYEYRVEGEIVDIPVKDIIHLRQGFDPVNVRKGMSDIAALYREIASDNEAANWTGSLLKNGAVPGVIISPEQGVTASADDLEQVKDTFIQRFGGDERGKPMVVGAPIKTQVLSFNPQEMNLRDLRIVPEERITAMLGIPAIVVGLGAGLQRSTFANFAEAREAAYESFVIPMQRLIAAELQTQLIPDFDDKPIPTLRLMFDLSQVRVLQVDQDALHNRARANLLAGGITLNQFLETIGEDPLVGPEGDVRYVPGTITVTPPDRLIPPEPVAAPADAQPGGPAALPAADEQRALVAAGATNGHAKVAGVLADPASLGSPLLLTDDDLERVSRVGPDDADRAERFWKQALDGSGFEGLIDAEPEGEG